MSKLTRSWKLFGHSKFSINKQKLTYTALFIRTDHGSDLCSFINQKNTKVETRKRRLVVMPIGNKKRNRIDVLNKSYDLFLV